MASNSSHSINLNFKTDESHEKSSSLLQQTDFLKSYQQGFSSSSNLPFFNYNGLMFGMGEGGLLSVMKGMSRKISPTETEARKLIDEWECRDQRCCYQGSLHDLSTDLKDTAVIAISYRHDEEGNFSRKGTGRVAKMRQIDQDLLVACIEGLGKIPRVQSLIIWCDQVISTNLKNQENEFPWYTSGILPYAAMKTLYLSSDISEGFLKNKIWILAERSCSKQAMGWILPDQAIRGHPGHHAQFHDPNTTVEFLAQQILSGFWPEDRGYWRNDYVMMKRWALTVACRTSKGLFLDVNKEIRDVDNMEMISGMKKLALLPNEMVEDGRKEPPIFTEDEFFFLKASAWNLGLEKMWQMDGEYVSHYMGIFRGMQYRFTWWQALDRKFIFGAFTDLDGSTAVIAERSGEVYRVFRTSFSSTFYVHEEKVAGPSVKKLIFQIAGKYDVKVGSELEWKYLYSSGTVEIEKEIFRPLTIIFKDMWRVNTIQAEVFVPEVYGTHSSRILHAAAARISGDGSTEHAMRKMFNATQKWNNHVRDTFHEFVEVSDFVDGPVWYEGVEKGTVTFGYYPFITYCLILDQHLYDYQKIKLPCKGSALRIIREFAANSTVDRQAFVQELFRDVTDDNVHEYLNTKDVARLMLSGACSSGLNIPSFSAFLAVTAQRLGFWTTRVTCRRGQLQIRFFNGKQVRIMQRKATCADFVGIGIVDLTDSGIVEGLSRELGKDEELPSVGDSFTNRNYFHPNLEALFGPDEFRGLFKNSLRLASDGSNICLVDMTRRDQKGREIAPNLTAVEGYDRSLVLSSETDGFSGTDYERELRGQDTSQFPNLLGGGAWETFRRAVDLIGTCYDRLQRS